MSAAGDAGMVVRERSPLCLREHCEKEKDGGNVSEKEDIQREERFRSISPYFTRPP